MSLNDLLEMSDDEVFRLVNKEFDLLKKQAALYKIISDMMDQLDKVRANEEEIEMQLERLKRENASLRKSIKEMSK